MLNLTRYGPAVARCLLAHQQRQMASAAAASDPVQKLFVEKIREFKNNNKGLDATNQKALVEETARLQRVYAVEDEAKLAQLSYSFPDEINVSLRDIDESAEKRAKIKSGEYQKQLTTQKQEVSALLASVNEPFQDEFHLPLSNKPDLNVLWADLRSPEAPEIVGTEPDYESSCEPVTPELLQRELRVRFGEEMPTIHDDKAPQRDVVNFPRIPQLQDCPPTRYHIVPESWFAFFYPKTGISGPYVFTGSFLTFLLSKEWLVWEHELLTGCSMAVICTYGVIKYGPKITQYLNKELNEDCEGWKRWREGHVSYLQEVKDHYSNELKKDDALKILYDIREQDIEVQLETEYRTRLQSVYEDTKRRLNYLVALADSQKQINYRNMVDWVINGATSSIGPKQETEVLDNCILNLKQLSAKNANVL